MQLSGFNAEQIFQQQALSLCEQANPLMSNGNFINALQLFDTALGLYPQIQNLQYARAFCLFQLNRVEDAKTAINCELITQPENKECIALLGKINNSLNPLQIQAKIVRSASLNHSYPDICLQAAMNSETFNNFRSHPQYTEVLEHVSEKQGLQYLDIIQNDIEISSLIHEFKANDVFGNPKTFYYNTIHSQISPTTLRYVKVLLDLKMLFGTLGNFNICEIGVGYGGQCRILNCFYEIKKYCLVDIKPALMLAQRFLDNFILGSTLRYKTMNELKENNYDLVISNYAFTELSREVQDVYLRKIILNSNRGYITWNKMDDSKLKSYRKEYLLEIIPNCQEIDESPLTAPDNCILVWGHQMEELPQPIPPPHTYKQKVIKDYAKKFAINTMIETGTYLGEMVLAMKDHFKKIYSIELSNDLYQRAIAIFSVFPHIKILQGDSGEVLSKIMIEINEPCLFWLDGHYSAGITAKGALETPIIKELETISKHSLKDKHVILIDDARCFNGECDYPTIEELKIFVKEKFPNCSFEVCNDIIRIVPL